MELKLISIRMPEEIIRLYKAEAARRGGNYQTLLKMDIKEIATQKYNFPKEVVHGKPTNV